MAVSPAAAAAETVLPWDDSVQLLLRLAALPCCRLLSGDAALRRANTSPAPGGPSAPTPARGAGTRAHDGWVSQHAELGGRAVVAKAPGEVLRPRSYGIISADHAVQLWRPDAPAGRAGACYAAARALLAARAARRPELSEVVAVCLQRLHGVLVIRCVCFSPSGATLHEWQRAAAEPPPTSEAAVQLCARLAAAAAGLHAAGCCAAVSAHTVRLAGRRPDIRQAHLEVGLRGDSCAADWEEGWPGGDAMAADPRWRPPEGRPSPAGDVYAIAALFWWLLGFGGVSHEARAAEATRAAAAMPHLSPLLAPLAERPEDRPTCAEFAVLLGNPLECATGPPDPDLEAAATAMGPPPAAADQREAAAAQLHWAAAEWCIDWDAELSRVAALSQPVTDVRPGPLPSGRHCDARRVVWRVEGAQRRRGGGAAVAKFPTRACGDVPPTSQAEVEALYGPSQPLALLAWEVTAASGLSHPRLVGFRGAGFRRVHGVPVPCCAVHDFCFGGPAQSVAVDGPGPPPPPQSPARIATLVRGAAEGLDYLHGCGIAHLAVRPERLLSDGEGGCLLGDFIYSRNRPCAGAQTVGRAQYRAPELPFSPAEEPYEQPQHRAADVYALGCVALVAWCGMRPGRGHAERAQQAAAAAERSPALAPLLPMLAEDPADRPSAARVLELAQRIVAAERPASAGGRWSVRNRRPRAESVAGAP